MTTGLPFDDFRALLVAPRARDGQAAERVAAAFRAAPGGRALGRLEEVAVWLAAWSGRPRPAVVRPLVALFAGSHGVAAHGISPRPADATAAEVERCGAGASPINQLCAEHDLGLKVFDLALDLPTGDISAEAALDERATAATMAFGMEAIAGGTDLVCVGAHGVGGSTVAAALCAALLGGEGRDWAGPGSGADAAMVARKAEAIDRALGTHTGNLADPLEALRRLGGREFSAMVGVILAARAERVPVILDGFAAVAAAVAVHAGNREATEHCLLASLSGEPGEARAAAALGLEPLLDLKAGVAGVGGAMAMAIVKSAARCHAAIAQSGAQSGRVAVSGGGPA